MLESAAVMCLALNIYFEARGQPLVERIAVTQVVMHRTTHDNFPATPCAVIYDGPLNQRGNPIRHRCQFSWWCDGLSDEPKYDSQQWAEAQSIAHGVYYNFSPSVDLVDGATHYHADYVAPRWSLRLTCIVQIGRHIFYRADP